MFCFIDQLPPARSLRKTLRVKDDDYRHSFLYGTYVTLTNLSAADLARIKRLRLSPLYVSVHSTDECIRKKLLGIADAPPILPLLQDLSGAGIRLHTQIVYCPAVNGDIGQTARSLAPYCESLSVVPVGLTEYHNPELRAVSKQEAEELLNLTEKLQAEFLNGKGTRFIWAADEFYLKAGRGIPLPETYEHYPQIDNGVGLIAKFFEDFRFGIEQAKHVCKSRPPCKKPVSIATGGSAYPYICEAARIITEQFGAQIKIYEVKNKFFGSSVTVAGLITGSCLSEQLKGKPLGGKLLLPSVMFRDGTGEFLDNMTLAELSGALGVPVEKVPADGESFVYSVLGLNL